jgi:hypothetical protein
VLLQQIIVVMGPPEVVPIKQEKPEVEVAVEV